MSVLTNLKEWLTIPEAAKHLSAELGEEVGESGIYRLALDGHLQLSLYFILPTNVTQCIFLPDDTETWRATTEEHPEFGAWVLSEVRNNSGKRHLIDSLGQDDDFVGECTRAAMHSEHCVEVDDECMYAFVLAERDKYWMYPMEMFGVFDLFMPSHYVQVEIKKRAFPDSPFGIANESDDEDDNPDDYGGGIFMFNEGGIYVLNKYIEGDSFAPETRFPKDGIPVVRNSTLQEFVSCIKGNHSKATISYQHQIHARLEPSTQQFKGGRITDTDVLTLDEAAKYACKHAGTDEITPADFLRAAARGEITLRAIVHREAKLQKHDDGIYCNQGEPTENTVPKGCIPNLPLSACKQLATAGRASWRTFDGLEQIDGELMRFTIATLSDSEPDFETVLADCRVIGFDVHALADEYIDAPAVTSGAPENAARAETPAERKQRIANYVNSAAAQGRSKESAYLELAVIEKCGVDNVKRIYHGKDAKAKNKTGW